MSEAKQELGWCILELLGHRRLGGFITEQEIAGAKFLRIDVPGMERTIATQLYSPNAVYCITPTTEDAARATAQLSIVAPVQRWELPKNALEHHPINSYDEGER